MRWAAVLVVLAGAVAAQAPPEALVRELAPGATFAAGEYREVKTWPATAFGHLTGQAVADPDTLGGRAWEARPGRDEAGRHLLYGPYAELPPGDYVAFFRLALGEAADDDRVAQVDATVRTGQEQLATADVWAGGLTVGRYAQVPLAFHYPGGKLELRLFWPGYAALRADGVSLFAFTGKLDPRPRRAPQPKYTGEPRNLPDPGPAKPFAELFPRPDAPDPNLVVCDARRLPADQQLFLLTLQGLVNRPRPRLYLLLHESDEHWLAWLKQSGRTRSVDTVTDAKELPARFPGAVRGLVVTDPRLAATRNVATTLAGVRNAAVASPRLAKQLGLPIVEDLRGRFKTNVEAYRWAFETLWPQLTHQVIACLGPETTAGLRDYLVQQRVFTFWLTGPIDGALPGGDPQAEVALMEELLARMPADIPVMGFPWAGKDVGIGEGDGIRLFAQFGKFNVGSADAANLSVHAGYPRPKLQQPRPAAPPLEPKVYVTWLMSDGDNLPVLERFNFPQLWADPLRGKLPMAWSMSPSAQLLMADVVDYYYRTATPNDVFVGAVSGIGYTYPDDFGQRYAPAARRATWGRFLTLTADAEAAADEREAWVMGVHRGDLIASYARHIPTLDGLFPDYGKTVASYADAFYPTARGVPVFHAATGWQEEAPREARLAGLVRDIRAMTPPERPAFLHLFLWNWGTDLALVNAVQAQLGPDYVAVRPDHLAALARAHFAREQVLCRAPDRLAGLPGRPLRFTVTAENVTDRAQRLAAAVTGGLDAARVTPGQTSLAPGSSCTLGVQGRPAGEAVVLRFTGAFGERTRQLPLRQVDPAELLAELPAGELRYVGRYEAAGLSHRSGQPAADPQAVSGTAWAAMAGVTEPGHIVFGPYQALPAGRYLALFRLKRTGPGTGPLARLDVHAAGAASDAAAHKLRVDDLPEGVWRSVPLTFDFPGGDVETRVYWPGRASVAVDGIDVWELAP